MENKNFINTYAITRGWDGNERVTIRTTPEKAAVIERFLEEVINGTALFDDLPAINIELLDSNPQPIEI